MLLTCQVHFPGFVVVIVVCSLIFLEHTALLLLCLPIGFAVTPKKDLSSRCLFRWAESSDMAEVVNNRLWLYPRPCNVLLWSILQDDHFRVRKQAIFPIGNSSFCFIIVPPILLDFLKSSSLRRTTFCTEIMKKCKGIAISRTNHLNTHNHHATSYWDILSLMP